MGAKQRTVLCSFSRQIFFTTYNVLGTVLVTEDTTVDRQTKDSALMDQHRNNNNKNHHNDRLNRLPQPGTYSLNR